MHGVIKAPKSKIRLLTKYGFVLLIQFALATLLVWTIFYFWKGIEFPWVEKFKDGEQWYAKVFNLLTVETLISWFVYVAIALILLKKKINLTTDILDQPLVKQISKLHSYVLDKVTEFAELRRLEGKETTFQDITHFIKDTLYLNDKKKFIDVFVIKNLPSLTPYHNLDTFINFISPELRQHIIGGN